MEDQIVMALSGGMEETMSMLIVEEVGSSLTLWSKHRRRYVNRDREMAHLKRTHSRSELQNL
jgi:hypothetical protein